MGVKDLYKQIEKYAHGTVHEHPLKHYAGKTLVIDISIFLYKWTHARVSVGGKNINHIQGVFYQASRMLAAGVRPLYAFDGAPGVEKHAVMQLRKEQRDNGALRVPHTATDDVKRVLDLMGVEYFQAAGEAETAAAAMILGERAYAIVSEDSDCLAYPHSRMIRLSGDVCMEYAHDDIAAAMGLTSEQFTQFCVMLGTDYNARVLPPTRAYNRLTSGLVVELPADASAALDVFMGVRPNLIIPVPGLAVHRPLRADPDALCTYLLQVGMTENRIRRSMQAVTTRVGASDDLTTDDRSPNACDGRMSIHGFSGCKWFAEAIDLALEAQLFATAVEVRQADWDTHIANLNRELGTAHETSPYVFTQCLDSRIFIGGYSDLRAYLGIRH